jgi:methylmalonyl-CoA mutase
VYGAEAAGAATALTAAGAQIYLAGRPGEIEATLKDAGVRDFIYVGCDVLAVLRTAHRELGL